MGKTKKKDNKKPANSKNPISNYKPPTKIERRLIGHLNGKPLYSINGKRPMVVTDEARSRQQVGKIGGGKILGVLPAQSQQRKPAIQDLGTRRTNPTLK